VVLGCSPVTVWEVVSAGRLGPSVQEESPCRRCCTRYPVSSWALSCQERLMEVSVVAVTWRFVAAGGATPSVVTEMGPAAAVPSWSCGLDLNQVLGFGQ
jgi:hypothetical protein